MWSVCLKFVSKNKFAFICSWLIRLKVYSTSTLIYVTKETPLSTNIWYALYSYILQRKYSFQLTFDMLFDKSYDTVIKYILLWHYLPSSPTTSHLISFIHLEGHLAKAVTDSVEQSHYSSTRQRWGTSCLWQISILCQEFYEVCILPKNRMLGSSIQESEDHNFEPVYILYSTDQHQ